MISIVVFEILLTFFYIFLNGKNIQFEVLHVSACMEKTHFERCGLSVLAYLVITTFWRAAENLHPQFWNPNEDPVFYPARLFGRLK